MYESIKKHKETLNLLQIENVSKLFIAGISDKGTRQLMKHFIIINKSKIL